jgi:hypothetical protein
MPNLEDMEVEAQQFGGTRTFAIGQHVVQIVSTRDRFSGNCGIEYRIGGWRKERSDVVALLAGQPPETVPTYAELLEQGGLRVGAVTRS